MKDLSVKTIIATLIFGLFLFTLVSLLFSENLFQGGKISVIEFEDYIIEITDARYHNQNIIFTYTIESIEPIEVTIEPIIQPDVPIQKEQKIHQETIGNYINVYTESYLIEEEVLPEAISVSFIVQGKTTRTIELEKE